ncbi:hypothetical protein QR98_0014010 [Sarcoptes scabiei]|uniref:Uncharacterized protein n=1 Tax=Sarcoptes scabiei TaxID=52283 RepID=A0A131ZW88_SARSC|nr:hypothetical protein QR98_0014010 [Sarcoptes scabiei]
MSTPKQQNSHNYVYYTQDAELQMAYSRASLQNAYKLGLLRVGYRNTAKCICLVRTYRAPIK